MHIAYESILPKSTQNEVVDFFVLLVCASWDKDGDVFVINDVTEFTF